MSGVSEIYPINGVTIREVGLRDGLQLVKSWPDTQQKSERVIAESKAGIQRYKLGSFLPAKHFAQFADVNDLIEIVNRLDGVHLSALTLNEHGAIDAVLTTVNELMCMVSATEAHSQANMRRSREKAIDLVGRIAKLRDSTAQDKLVNAGIAMASGCSISRRVKPVEVIRLAEACLDAGADKVGVADTVGYAAPAQVQEMVSEIRKLAKEFPLIINLHDTRGIAIANASAALDAGANVSDGSLGGLGGCPFAPGTTGNVVTEDLVHLCERMGFATGIDLEALLLVREMAEAAMPKENFHGVLYKARAPKNMNWRAS